MNTFTDHSSIRLVFLDRTPNDVLYYRRMYIIRRMVDTHDSATEKQCESLPSQELERERFLFFQRGWRSARLAGSFLRWGRRVRWIAFRLRREVEYRRDVAVVV